MTSFFTLAKIILFSICFLLAISGCSLQNVNENFCFSKKYATGLVIVSFTNPHTTEIFVNLALRRVGNFEGISIYIPSKRFLVLELNEGWYEFYQWHGDLTSKLSSDLGFDSNVPFQSTPFSSKFNVVDGRAIYLGEFELVFSHERTYVGRKGEEGSYSSLKGLNLGLKIRDKKGDDLQEFLRIYKCIPEEKINIHAYLTKERKTKGWKFVPLILDMRIDEKG